jgi:hypothetical protein
MRGFYCLHTCLYKCIYVRRILKCSSLLKNTVLKIFQKINNKLQSDIPVEWSNKISIFTEIPAVKRQERYWRIHWNSNFILIVIIAHKIAGWILLFFFAKTIKNIFFSLSAVISQPLVGNIKWGRVTWTCASTSDLSSQQELQINTYYFCHQHGFIWIFTMVLN